MRKLVMFNLVSLDGFFARENGDIDWHVVDQEFNEYAIASLEKIDTILFGRVTYTMFEDFWPKALIDPKTSKEDRIVAKRIQDATKIVFSKTLKDVTWQGAKLYQEIEPEIIKKLKSEKGGEIVIYGSGTIVQQLANLDLIDEYRVMVNPVVLGKGKPLFKDNHLNLKLLKTKIFTSGNVLLCYTK